MTYWRRIIRSKKFKTLSIFLFIFLSLLLWLSIKLYGHYYLSNDNAYVGADVVQISARVTGKVNNLYVNNDQHVEKGTLLFTIDPAPFQARVDAAKAQVLINEAELQKSSITAERLVTLVEQQYSSLQTGDNARATLKRATGSLQYANALLAQADLNLQYTEVRAPVSGWISNITLRAGDAVQANQALFALISDQRFWIDSNFKETDIEPIKIGQKVVINVDMYPDHPFQGVVSSIGNYAGNAFSLLPPQNATANWVKVTQRVPVRIDILNPNAEFPLRIGTSATVTIHLMDFTK